MSSSLGRLARRLPVLGPLLRDRDRLRAELLAVGAEFERVNRLRLAARAELGRMALARQADTPWMRAIARAQEEIAGDPGTREFYRQGYRAQEALYWLEVPGWLWADHAARPIRRLLDVGAAYGTLSLFARRSFGCRVDLVDFNDTYLSRALAARHELHFQVCNVELEPLPWPEARYDAIVLTEVLEHFNFHPVPTLVKLRQALAPGGRLYLTTPDAEEWGRVLTYYPSLAAMPPPTPGQPLRDTHLWQYLEVELREVLAAAGLAIERFALVPGVEYRHFNLTARAADGPAATLS